MCREINKYQRKQALVIHFGSTIKDARTEEETVISMKVLSTPPSPRQRTKRGVSSRRRTGKHIIILFVVCHLNVYLSFLLFIQKVTKPVMEKRRRERINHSLETLRVLMLESTHNAVCLRVMVKNVRSGRGVFHIEASACFTTFFDPELK